MPMLWKSSPNKAVSIEYPGISKKFKNATFSAVAKNLVIFYWHRIFHFNFLVDFKGYTRDKLTPNIFYIENWL